MLRDKEKYQSPEDAYSFGRLLVYMFANWSFAWKLNFFPMPQVERYIKSLVINNDSYTFHIKNNNLLLGT